MTLKQLIFKNQTLRLREVKFLILEGISLASDRNKAKLKYCNSQYMVSESLICKERAR